MSAKRVSVVRFPFDRMLAMLRDRCTRVSQSAMEAPYRFLFGAGLPNLLWSHSSK
jgi:hypothetical protein